VKRLAISAALALAIAFLIPACASRDEASSDGSSSQAASVPGERVSDEGALTPGAAGSSASVHWWSSAVAATRFSFRAAT